MDDLIVVVSIVKNTTLFLALFLLSLFLFSYFYMGKEVSLTTKVKHSLILLAIVYALGIGHGLVAYHTGVNYLGDLYHKLARIPQPTLKRGGG